MRTVAVLGGTGKEGGGLALRWAKAGYKVILGSRSAEKAMAEAEVMNQELGSANVSGAANLDAAKQADVIVLAVPYAGQKATADDVRGALAGKILIDVTVPLVPPKVSVVQMPPEGSAVLALQKHLGADVKVVSAFQNISAEHLRDLHHQMDCDVLVCADDQAAGDVGVELAEAAGMKGWFCGPLANSVVAEGLTSVLIGINRRYKIPGSGIRITGQPKPAA
ncbi:MAG: NADPH-dependent F420 reductase [Rhodospirillaceae bacterium]|nr:NADPH-dependent F420 reductase [Rhodospirillaceae bacterium]